MLPTHRFVEESILEREVLPSDDEYDLSMVVDATKQEFTDKDVTAKDLMAIAVSQDASDDAESDDEYTLNEEIDFKTLEQDYEDELTATQALNAEMAKAAAELKSDINEIDDIEDVETAKIVAIDGSVLDSGSHDRVTVEDDDDETAVLTDLDDTGVNEALLMDHDDLTAEIPHASEGRELDWSFEGTVELPARDSAGDTGANTQVTAKLPSAENDPEPDMDVESGHFRTKKLSG